MKTLCLICFMLLLLLACKKEVIVPETAEQNLIAAAHSYFSHDVLGARVPLQRDADSHGSTPEFPGDFSRMPLWNKAQVKNTTYGEVVVVPVHYQSRLMVVSSFSDGRTYNMNDLTKLIIYKDPAKQFHAELISYFPDKNYAERPFNGFQGIASVEDWAGDRLHVFQFESGQSPKTIKELPNMTDAATRMNTITICYYSEGYNSSSDDSNGYYWSVLLGCNTYTFDDGRDNGGGFMDGGFYEEIGGGGGGGGFSPANTITIPTGDNVIGNISDYLKCFDNVPGSDHKYKVTLCVAQPYPGTRENWGFSGSGAANGNGAVFVGHTFLILTETTPNKTITRNVGFYPNSSVTPFSPSAQGQLNNDANSDYNISLSITMTSSQFAQILQYIQLGNNTGFMYNLNSNNCSTFALNALRAGGINLPRTEGNWLNGSGLNPGDLGEDIRAMSLASNMTRSTTFTYHPNQGNCQ